MTQLVICSTPDPFNWLLFAIRPGGDAHLLAEGERSELEREKGRLLRRITKLADSS